MITRERLIADGWSYHCGGANVVWSKVIENRDKRYVIDLIPWCDGHWHLYVEDERFANCGLRVVDTMEQLGLILKFCNR